MVTRYLLPLFLAIFVFLPMPAQGGGCTGSCGGDQYRQPLQDLAVDAFETLLNAVKQSPDRQLRVGSGSLAKIFSEEEIRDLQTALLGSIQKNEIKIEYSQNDWECPLKDNGGTCVTFLTDTRSKQLSVDIGRILRQQSDLHFLNRTLIHEAHRLLMVEDKNDQYSRWLAEVVQKKSTTDPNIIKSLNRLTNAYREQIQNKGNPPDECDPRQDPVVLQKNLAEIQKVIAAASRAEEKKRKWKQEDDEKRSCLQDYRRGLVPRYYCE